MCNRMLALSVVTAALLLAAGPSGVLAQDRQMYQGKIVTVDAKARQLVMTVVGSATGTGGQGPRTGTAGAGRDRPAAAGTGTGPGRQHTFSVAQDAAIMLDGRRARLRDLRGGMLAKVWATPRPSTGTGTGGDHPGAGAGKGGTGPAGGDRPGARPNGVVVTPMTAHRIEATSGGTETGTGRPGTGTGGSGGTDKDRPRKD